MNDYFEADKYFFDDDKLAKKEVKKNNNINEVEVNETKGTKEYPKRKAYIKKIGHVQE